MAKKVRCVVSIKRVRCLIVSGQQQDNTTVEARKRIRENVVGICRYRAVIYIDPVLA